jgi:hypothetical protein
MPCSSAGPLPTTLVAISSAARGCRKTIKKSTIPPDAKVEKTVQPLAKTQQIVSVSRLLAKGYRRHAGYLINCNQCLERRETSFRFTCISLSLAELFQMPYFPASLIICQAGIAMGLY